MPSRDPIGITDGSTATAPQPTGIPLAVRPGSEYAVATTVSERTPVEAAPGASRGAPGTGAAIAGAEASARAFSSRPEIWAVFDLLAERRAAIFRSRSARAAASDDAAAARTA